MEPLVLEYATSDGHPVSSDWLNARGNTPVAGTNRYAVTLLEGETEIGPFNGAGSGNITNLTDVFIPEGITSIAERAFFGCRFLRSVRFPETLTGIGSGAFTACNVGLTNVVIPSGVENISSGMFSACSEVGCVILSDGVKTIGGKAFTECTALRSMSLPGTVMSIGSKAFDKSPFGLIVCHAETPPSIYADTFKATVSKTCTLYVPKGSAGAYMESAWGSIFTDGIREMEEAEPPVPPVPPEPAFDSPVAAAFRREYIRLVGILHDTYEHIGSDEYIDAGAEFRKATSALRAMTVIMSENGMA